MVLPGCVHRALQNRARVNTVCKCLIGTGLAGVVIVGLVLWGNSQLWSDTPADAERLTRAYEVLAQGQTSEAEALFKPLLAQADSGVQSQGYTGLAAVAFTNGNHSQTLELAQHAATLEPESIYSYVLRGHVLLHQGKIAEAAAAYRTATEKTRGFPWQKATAHNRLGRIAAVAGKPEEALAHYDQALQQPHLPPPEQALTYTNKGHVLEKLGKHREALTQYRQAQTLQPNDRFTGTLLREAERRTQVTQDQQKQERIDTLVEELLRLHRQGRAAPPQDDAWTSSRLTLAMLPIHGRGTVSARAGEEDFLFLRLVDALQATGRIVVVDRDMLEKTLSELQLSATQLVEPQTAVRLGGILAARLLATGTLTRLGDEAQFSLHVVETETTRLQAAVTRIVALPSGIDQVVEQLATALLHKLRAAYPVQGRIVQVTPEHILLNIGTEHGLTSGLRLEVLGAEEALNLDGKIIGYRRPRVGLLEVTGFQEAFAQAMVLEQTGPFMQGWKVKEVPGP